MSELVSGSTRYTYIHTYIHKQITSLNEFAQYIHTYIRALALSLSLLSCTYSSLMGYFWLWSDWCTLLVRFTYCSVGFFFVAFGVRSCGCTRSGRGFTCTSAVSFDIICVGLHTYIHESACECVCVCV